MNLYTWILDLSVVNKVSIDYKLDKNSIFIDESWYLDIEHFSSKQQI